MAERPAEGRTVISEEGTKMADKRPNMSKEKVFERTKHLIQDKPEYRGVLETLLKEMEADHDDHDRENSTQVDVRNLSVNLGRLSYLKRKDIAFKPISTNSWKVWELTNKEGVEKALKYVSEQTEIANEKQTPFERDRVQLTEEDRREFRELAQKEDMLPYWAPYINPNIEKMLLQKKAILLSLASLDDFQGKRGRIHVLFYGPGGTAKSDLLEWTAEKLGHGQCLGPRTSEVGLTGDASGSSVRLGVLPENHGGFACVDEVEKFGKRDRGGLYKSMANGVVPINVGDHRERYSAETRVMAACNKQDKLSAPLLTRFDFKLECKNPPKREGKKIVRKIVLGWRKEDPDYAGTRLRKYLKWVHEFKPSITARAQEKLADALEGYVDSHAEERIQVRNYERFLRIVWAIARLNRRDIEIRNGRFPDLERTLELCPDASPTRIEVSS